MPTPMSRPLVLSSSALFAGLWLSSLSATPGLTACTSEASDGTADTAQADDTPETSADSDTSEGSLDTEVEAPDVEPTLVCWPGYGQARCEELGWTWQGDYATSYCPNPGENCPPPTDASFCALPCSDDSDCAGTTVPFCGPIAWWGGSDGYHCSSFKVCVPLKPEPSWCYYRRPEELCPR